MSHYPAHGRVGLLSIFPVTQEAIKTGRELLWGFELYIKFEIHHPLIMPVSQIPSLLLTKEHLSNSEVKCAYLCAYLQILI